MNIRKLKILCLIGSVFLPGLLWGQESSTETVKTSEEKAKPTITESKPEPTHATVQESAPVLGNASRSLLVMGARIDGNFSAGDPVQQGFSIPSLRISATGEVNDHFSYRLSFGQTKEFSTILLSQLAAMEAYVDLASSKVEGVPLVTWRVGMFTPMLSPWWTPDLAELELPDYHTTHRTLLLSPDIGTQLAYRPAGGRLEMVVGAFNGNGNLSLNSNFSKAFTAYVKGNFVLGAVHLSVGASGYTLNQGSASSNVNFKQDWLADLFTELQFGNTDITAEVFGGNFQDSTTNVSPFGWAATLTLALLPSVKAFAREEQMRSSPLGTAGWFKHLQVGPIFELDSHVHAYALYDFSDDGNGSVVNSGLIRLRLVI